MVFSSIVFLLYFLPVLLILYYVTPNKFRNILLLLASTYFYSWGAPKFIFVILGTSLLDYFLVHQIDKAENQRKRTLFLIISVSINLGLLFYFKYANFFIENVNAAFSLIGIKNIAWVKLALPIGISFYTFETITYVVDVYRKVHKPLHNFWDYQLYILLFPKLIAGPIIRYHDLAEQINDRSANDTPDFKLTGFYRFCFGLAKKVLIANQMGVVADEIFKMNYSEMDMFTAWIGALAYTFQIFFDFSGYSDMAIGIAKMLGFIFPENFNNPYISQSITEFWRRWHISLGAWMRNYLYIPLGGNQVKSNARLYFNLWIVFLASGLWHGASWSFVFWGAYHGLFLVLERSFLLNIYKKIGSLASTILTFIFVVIGWVFFKIEDLSDGFLYLSRMFSCRFFNPISLDFEFYFWLTVSIFFAFFTFFDSTKNIHDQIYVHEYSPRKHLFFACISLVLFILCISSITASQFNPFIYFRF